MAMGYAKSTGRTGAFTVVPGPGRAEHGGRAVHGDGQLRPAGVPHGPSAVAVPRQGPRPLARARRPDRHSAHADQGRRPHRRPGGHVRDRRARVSHRPQRPAGPGIGGDVLGHDGGGGDGRASAPATRRATSRSRTSTRSARPRGCWPRAKRPMIMCGAGAQHAAEEVRALAELLGAPVTAFRSGRGVVPEDHPLGVAQRRGARALGRRRRAARHRQPPRDALHALARSDALRARAERRPEADPDRHRAARDDAVPSRRRRSWRTRRRRAGCSRTGLASRAAPEPRAARGNRSREAHCARAHAADPAASRLPRRHPQRVAARRILGSRAVAGRIHDLHRRLPRARAAHVRVRGPSGHARLRVPDGARRQSREPRHGRGLRHGRRRADVRDSRARDRGAIPESASSTIVFNNRSYGNVLRDQQLQFGGRTIGAELENPDFVKLAESFGVAGRARAHAGRTARRARASARRPTALHSSRSPSEPRRGNVAVGLDPHAHAPVAALPMRSRRTGPRPGPRT